jgi:hypothetical protein
MYMAYPTGTIEDAIRKTDMNGDFLWNSNYTYSTNVTDSLWTVVFKIPYKDMRFNPKPPYNWKVILTRYNKKGDEYYSIPYVITKDGKDYFTKAVDITLTHKIKPNSNWKFRPYIVDSYDLIAKEGSFKPEHAGIDISFNPGTLTKLKVAINPDFSDVPLDDASNNYNSKYPPWYGENRFFFTEDLDAFEVEYSTFYSRYIAQPQIAVKLTGNSQTWKYGYLCARDKKITDDGYVINNDDFYQLASVIKTLPRFKAGFSTASRTNTGYYNHIASVFWDWEFIKKLHCGTSHLASIRHQEQAFPANDDNKFGLMSVPYFSAYPGNWSIETKYLNLQKDLRVDMGTFYDTGYEEYDLSTSWGTDVKEQYLRKWGFFTFSDYCNNLDAQKTLNNMTVNGTVYFQFLPKYNINFGVSRNREAYNKKEYDKQSANCAVSLNRWTTFSCFFSYALGSTLIYDLEAVKPYYNMTISTSGSIGQKFNWSISADHYQYDYDRNNTIITSVDTTYVELDDSYQILNATANFNFSNNMNLFNGLGFSNYEMGELYANMSFYSNFRYEFKPDRFIYLGYKTGQYQDIASKNNDVLGHFKRNTASVYVKLSATI